MSLNKLTVGEFNKLSNKLEAKISSGESVLHEPLEIKMKDGMLLTIKCINN